MESQQTILEDTKVGHLCYILCHIVLLVKLCGAELCVPLGHSNTLGVVGLLETVDQEE